MGWEAKRDEVVSEIEEAGGYSESGPVRVLW